MARERKAGRGPPSSPASSASALAVATTISVGDNLPDANLSYFGSDGELRWAFSLDFNLRAHMKTHLVENYHVCPNLECVRSRRYALLLEDGVVKVLNLEDGGLASSVEYIPNARVPLLKYISMQHNISFDVSINNHLGVMKSNVLKWLSEIDDRFRDMLKEWAKAQDINDLKSGSLSSYALCLLVIFHFQTCEPPIFPSLRAIINEERIFDRGWSNFSRSPFEDVCSINIQRFRSSRMINQSSLAQLLLSFFDKILELLGQIIASRHMKDDKKAILVDDLSTLQIEDPFERMENAARTINGKVGGRDTILVNALSSRIPLVSDQPTIIFGVDITHPHPGEDSSPSVAVVVAS
ncbi:hypothetical protein ZIOFF_026531 [Zingiber officinale]|uniref:Piwi domain-containing protein n=1 Tax=Zingiber officinale TaxID=94328 RepID=A0A8J5GWH8_ZINOF|nr:hypothetical protein ZIOFF_026531 [Zingiber officinale]